MKVEVNSSALADAVAWTTRIINSRPVNPLLAGIKISAEDGVLQFNAYDNLSTRRQIEAGVDEKGSILVLGKLLADITRTLPSETTYLSSDDTTLTITSGKSKFVMKLMPEEEYPELPAIPNKLGQVDTPTFNQIVNQVCISSLRSEAGSIFSKVMINFEDNKVIMLATDRSRLSRAEFTWTPDIPNINFSVLLQSSVLHDISRSLDVVQNLVIDLDTENLNTIGFENAGAVTTSQLSDGNFPDTDRLFKDDYPIHIVIKKDELLKALKRVSLVAHFDHSIKMECAGSELKLVAGSTEESQATEVIDIDKDGDDITFLFNPNYLIDCLNVVEEPYIRLKAFDSIQAVEIDGQQEQDSEESLNFRYIIVPIRGNVD
ncbi:MAG: DNA polymerase III subunit beta [Bifidobacteriaceae bacterium]|nr:DNA polymerase III subunit beta [Bifidobacteriaceae bacterium]